jgi:ubiquinol-cytochrome c reductase cytochrome b subunit
MTAPTETETEATGPVSVSSPVDESEDAAMLTARLRRAALDALPPDRLLPDRQPTYVASWIYVFGVLTISALLVVIVTGCILALFGPTWWHLSSVGLFVNSLHL